MITTIGWMYLRMGWFLSSSCVEEMWAQGVMVDHWRALLNSTVARSFSWWGNPELLQVCPHYNVTAYKSSRCTKSRRNCATLFSSFKGSPIHFLCNYFVKIHWNANFKKKWLGIILFQNIFVIDDKPSNIDLHRKRSNPWGHVRLRDMICHWICQ